MNRIIDETSPVGDLAVRIHGAAGIFEQNGIDFCCAGQRTLRAACESQGIATEAMVAALRQQAQQAALPAGDAHWLDEPIPALIAHIVARHHQYVRSEVPRIQQWMDKVVAAHGERRPELIGIRHSFAAIASEMAPHMAKEELVLFPAIARLASPAGADQAAGAPRIGSITSPVQAMMAEHDHTGRDLSEMREASGGYTPPPEACATFRVLYQALREFESDMRQHVHLENNILFPRALALESGI